MNYMKEVAQILGVELDEEFYIKGNDNKFKITNNGMCYSFKSCDMWSPVSWIICDILNGKLEIVKKPKPILDEVEKRYLSNVIKPFRNQIESIVKYSYGKYEAINMVNFKVDENMSFNVTNFPYFKKGTMYKGMEVNKEYSLEDLEL